MSPGTGQILADPSPGEGEHPVDDKGERGPRVTQHVDVGAEDTTDPWQEMLQPLRNTKLLYIATARNQNSSQHSDKVHSA